MKAKLAIFLALIMIIANFYILDLLRKIEIRKISVEVTVGEDIGFNVDNSSLTFGTVMPGSIGRREIVVSYPHNSQILMWTEGEIREWIAFSENNLILDKNDNRNISIYLKPSKEAEYGYYSGVIYVKFNRI